MLRVSNAVCFTTSFQSSQFTCYVWLDYAPTLITLAKQFSRLSTKKRNFKGIFHKTVSLCSWEIRRTNLTQNIIHFCDLINLKWEFASSVNKILPSHSRWRNMEKCTSLFISKCFFHPRRASERNVFCGETCSSKRAQKQRGKHIHSLRNWGKWKRKVCRSNFFTCSRIES